MRNSKYHVLLNYHKLEKSVLGDTLYKIRDLLVYLIWKFIYLNKPNGGTHIEKQWSKFDAFCLMLPNNSLVNKFKNSNQAWAGFILLRKQFLNQKLIILNQ